MRKIIEDKIKSSSEEQVDLGRMEIQDGEIEEIAKFIVLTKPHVQEIYLNNNSLGDAGGVILGKQFFALKKLIQLNLQFNNLHTKGISALTDLQLQNPNLQLALHGNKIYNVSELK